MIGRVCGLIHKDERKREIIFIIAKGFVYAGGNLIYLLKKTTTLLYLLMLPMMYDDMTWKAEEREREHENLGMVVRSSQHTVEYTDTQETLYQHPL